jgi:hypothetical protein
MIWGVLSLLARVLGPFLPFLATWVAAKQQARLKARNDALEADKAANERINHADVSRGNADADSELAA